MRRVVVPELLDSDAGTPPEIEAALADLRWFSRWFGGTSTLQALLERVVERTGQHRLSLLDVAAGPGEASLTAAERLRRAGVSVHVTLLDRAATHLHANGTRLVVGDALALPLRDDSFDLVTSSLFLHHLEPEEIVRSIDEALRVCRVAVLINDLRRHPLHLALALAGVPLYRSRLTRHDAPASVRRAYTEAEFRKMLAQTNAAQVEITRHYLYRAGIVAWKEHRG
jgi:ubiquinone/menaquinone biosynthesis C-methylase UbiE